MSYNVDIYSEIPANEQFQPGSEEIYLQSIIKIAQNTEAYGLNGSLLYYNHQILDPWTLAITIAQHTRKLIPLVALQPYTIPPFTAAKIIQSIAYIFGRQVNLNLIAGAKEQELQQINDRTSHDSRYKRISEYTDVLNLLLFSKRPVYYEGEFYQIGGLQLEPTLPEHLKPKLFMSGSSDASIETAHRIADIAITHPGPIDQFQTFVQQKFPAKQIDLGMRIGIIARETKDDAWDYASNKYQITKKSERLTLLKTKSESVWNKNMAVLAIEQELYDDVYWLGGFKSGAEFNPILVGSYDDVADYLLKYLELGVNKFIINNLSEEQDFEHIERVFRRTR
ncbi:LLM class flavin-dependent oxidoreductase [Paenibacillus sp. SI8]|uniref:LLM class flavin-dependent oxidoreductase n=1 Tax=unclassified Paenibacillus TaxID=185978 RepID=UPI0034653F0F